MEYLTTKNIKQNSGTIVTIGNFDGVHRGHTNLIDKVNELKNTNYQNLKTVVFTFSPHPKSFIEKTNFKLIFNYMEKHSVFSELKIDVLIEYPFDIDTMTMSPEEFVERVLIEQLNCKILVVGKDYGFGKNKSGNSDFLKEELAKYGVEVIIPEDVLYMDEKLGSSKIREVLSYGDMERVTDLLGKPFFIIGEVVHGKELGKQIGFPTMNIIPPADKLLPPRGVYISKVCIDDKYYSAVTNVGVNPTVSGETLVVESHLLDFDADLYGKVVKVEMLKAIRSEKKFNSIEELKEQIDKDVCTTKDYFKKLNK